MPQNSGVTDYTYYIETYGCTYNQSDSEKIISILNSSAFKQSSLKDAQILIFNTCAVKQTTENKIIHRIEFISKQFPQKRIIITGCLQEIQKKIRNRLAKAIKENGLFVHPKEITNINNILSNLLHSENSNQIKPNYDKSFIFPEINPNSKIGLVQISEGCIYNCTYCCTKLARGNLVSFDFNQIVKQIKYFLEHGVYELCLTSQDLGIYNYYGRSLIDLLNEIIKLPGEYLIRLGMLNPNYLISNIDTFLKILENNKFFRYLHIPIQSASDEILRKMKRAYKIEAMDGILKKIINFDPKLTFSTDIITGFPTETDEDHQKTINFVLKWKPDVLNISKYSNRPNTLAKQFPQVDSLLIKKRSKEITAIFEEYIYEKMKKWIGWEGKVYISELSKNIQFPFSGRNVYNKPILVDKGEIGKFVNVRIVDTSNYSLVGQRV